LRHKTTLQTFRRHSAPSIVRNAVRGIAEACVSNPDDILHDLLRDSIREVESIREREVAGATQRSDLAAGAQDRRRGVTA
jgi:ribosomal protein S7